MATIVRRHICLYTSIISFQGPNLWAPHQSEGGDANYYISSLEDRFGTFNKNKHQLLVHFFLVVHYLLGQLLLLIVHLVNHLGRILHVYKIYERVIGFKIAEKITGQKGTNNVLGGSKCLSGWFVYLTSSSWCSGGPWGWMCVHVRHRYGGSLGVEVHRWVFFQNNHHQYHHYLDNQHDNSIFKEENGILKEIFKTSAQVSLDGQMLWATTTTSVQLVGFLMDFYRNVERKLFLRVDLALYFSAKKNIFL